MSQTIDDINRLLWLCREVVLRTQEERVDVLVRLLNFFPEEMKTIAFRLHQAGILEGPEHVPFTVRIHRSGRGEERQAVWDLYVFDPLDFWVIFSETIKIVWCNRGGLELKFGPEVKRRFVKRMKQWVRFLEAESEKLQSSSTAAAALLQMEPPNQTEAEKQTLAKGRKSPRKNGRPPRANLAPKQLEQIHRRVLDGQSLSSIFRSYEVGFSYDTFRRLYYIWQDKQGEGQRSKEQNRR